MVHLQGSTLLSSRHIFLIPARPGAKVSAGTHTHCSTYRVSHARALPARPLGCDDRRLSEPVSSALLCNREGSNTGNCAHHSSMPALWFMKNCKHHLSQQSRTYCLCAMPFDRPMLTLSDATQGFIKHDKVEATSISPKGSWRAEHPGADGVPPALHVSKGSANHLGRTLSTQSPARLVARDPV